VEVAGITCVEEAMVMLKGRWELMWCFSEGSRPQEWGRNDEEDLVVL
jgi:hypothetical protein